MHAHDNEDLTEKCIYVYVTKKETILVNWTFYINSAKKCVYPKLLAFPKSSRQNC